MKQAMKESAPFQHEGIMSISKSLAGNVDTKIKGMRRAAEKQGVDLDKMSEQELKYLIELNKPRAPKVYSNEEAYEILNRFANQNKRGEVIKADFGKPFAEEVVTVERVITDIKKLEPMESMKEANRVLRGEGKYKSLSKADREKIVGDESVTDHIFERNIEPEDFEPEDFAQGGRTGLSYLLAEDTNERMPLAGGGSGKPPINFYFDMQGGAGKEQKNFLGIEGLTQKGYDYGGTLAADTTFPLFGGELSVGGELGFGRDKSDVDYKGRPIGFLSGVGETKLGDDWNVGMKWRKKFAGGGMGRRAFLKLMAALGLTGAAAKYGLPTLFKKATPKVAKELTEVPIKNIKGMPAWFKPLVNKVIKEGTEINSGAERVITHKTKLPNSKTEVYVNQDLNTGDVTVDLGMEKHGFADGKFGQPVRLEYKAAEEIPLKRKKGSVKTKEEFNVEEAEFTGGHPENVKFEESTVNKFGNHESNFDEVEMFATGKVKKVKTKSKPRPINQKDIE